MASEGDRNIYIKPNTATGIRVTSDYSTVTSYTISGEYIVVTSPFVSGSAPVTIEASGYNTIIITDPPHEISHYDIYVTLTPVTYISTITHGDTTYTIKDAEARETLTNKQDTLVSGTNIKTINSTSILGSGNISTPDTKNTAGSTNTSSKIFLIGATSQGANPQTYSHDTVFVDTSGQLNSANPASTANSTIVATTKWVKDQGYTTDAFPSQSGQSGKFLTTNGSTVSWATIDAFPSQTGNATKSLVTNGTTVSWQQRTKVTIRDWSVNNS